jgi:cytidine deaminase
MTPNSQISSLICHARSMQKQALCTYSNFPVGAAILTDTNQIIGGFNVESASYGLTMCAERVALYHALVQGFKNFTHVALVTDTASFPCGACRQMLYEFCPQADIIIATPEQVLSTHLMNSLLPHGFGQNDVGKSAV